MMNLLWLEKLERRFGHLAIANLPAKLIGIKMRVWLMVLWWGDDLLMGLYQEANVRHLGMPASCLITVIAPPGSDSMAPMDLVWSCLMNVVFMYSFSRMLEQHLGTFRFNLLLGVYFILQGLLTYYALVPLESIYQLEGLRFSFIFISIGILIPNYIIYAFMIIPVRMRILAVIAILLQVGLAAQLLINQGHWSLALWFASPAVYSLTFLALPRFLDRAKHKARHMAFEKKSAIAADKTGYFHRCSTCGITDNDDRETYFRVGSDGQDYCEKHLR